MGAILILSSKLLLDALLVHSGKHFYIPAALAVHMKETNAKIAVPLDTIKYAKH